MPHMDYANLIAKLYAVNINGGAKFGLENTFRLSKALDLPERKFPVIHVAGTNGKGSVATKVARGLESSKSGLKVGLYTSPHISCFRERIRINGAMITESDVENVLGSLFTAAEQQKIAATFFELTTMLAFHYFAKSKVDYAVLETGLGGRLDATNICLPELCIITSISLEHTEILGSTLKEIAIEKAGIIKPGVPVILGPRVPFVYLEPIIKSLKAPCIKVKGSFANYNEENNAIAGQALETLGVPAKAIEEGLKGMPPCRMETLFPDSIPIAPCPEAVILDVAHNPDGLEHLFSAIEKRYPQKSLRIVCGLSKNKDIPACLKILTTKADDFHLVESANGRGLPAGILHSMLRESGVSAAHLSLQPTIEESVAFALKEAARHKQILVICGTFFIMSSARAVLGISEPRDPLDLNERLSNKGQ